MPFAQREGYCSRKRPAGAPVRSGGERCAGESDGLRLSTVKGAVNEDGSAGASPPDLLSNGTFRGQDTSVGEGGTERGWMRQDRL